MDKQEIQKLRQINAVLEKELGEATTRLQQLNRALEIEAALEKVRARIMTMRNSNELSETSALLFHQLNELGIHAIRTGVGIFHGHVVLVRDCVLGCFCADRSLGR